MQRQGMSRLAGTNLRHTFCTRLAEAGVLGSTMLALMGHMSRAMLECYSHIRMAARREALAAITLRPVIENRKESCESPCRSAAVPNSVARN